MNITEVVSLVTNVGVPIGAMIVMGFYTKSLSDKLITLVESTTKVCSDVTNSMESLKDVIERVVK